MAKIQLNESDLTRMIEEATKKALAQIVNEGRGFNALKGAFDAGLDGDMDNMSDEDVEDYIQNGSDNITYQKFVDRKNKYNDAQADYERAVDFKNGDGTIPSDFDGTIDDYVSNKDNIRQRRAGAAVGVQPGAFGRLNRRAVATAGKAGRGVRNLKNKATDFVHNTIGLEESNK